jgi:hypothetical protein
VVAGGATVQAGGVNVTGTSQFNGDITLANGTDFVCGTLSGTRFGTGPTQLIGFYGAAGVPRESSGTLPAAAFVANTSGIADDTATFGGYTIGQIVSALQNLGLIV